MGSQRRSKRYTPTIITCRLGMHLPEAHPGTAVARFEAREMWDGLLESVRSINRGALLNRNTRVEAYTGREKRRGRATWSRLGSHPCNAIPFARSISSTRVARSERSPIRRDFRVPFLRLCSPPAALRSSPLSTRLSLWRAGGGESRGAGRRDAAPPPSGRVDPKLTRSRSSPGLGGGRPPAAGRSQLHT